MDYGEKTDISLLELKEANNAELEYKLLWKFKTGDSINVSPCVYRDMVFVNSSDGFIYAISAREGKELWKKNLILNDTDIAVNSSPVVSDGTLYISSFRVLYAIETASGASTHKIKGYFNHAPVSLYKNTIFVNQKEYLYAYDKNFKKIWKYKASGYIESPVAIKDDMIFFGTEEGRIYGLTQKGEILWKMKVKEGIEAKPEIYGNRLFIGNREGNVYSIDYLKGKLRWKNNVKGEILSSCRVYKDNLYVLSSLGYIYSFNRKTGILNWEADVAGTIYSSPVIENGIIYFGTSGRSKTFYAISIYTGQVLWNFNMEDDLLSTVIINNNNIYITSADGNLYCFLKSKISENMNIETDKNSDSNLLHLNSHSDTKNENADLELSKDDLNYNIDIKENPGIEHSDDDLSNNIDTHDENTVIEHSDDDLNYNIDTQDENSISELSSIDINTDIIDIQYTDDDYFDFLNNSEEDLFNIENREDFSGEINTLSEEDLFQNDSLDIDFDIDITMEDDLFISHITDSSSSELEMAKTVIKKKIKKKKKKIIANENISEDEEAEKYFKRGKIKFKKNEIESAIINFKKAIKLSPANSDYLAELAMVLKEKGDIDEAVKCYERAFVLDPEREDLYDSYISLSISKR